MFSTKEDKIYFISKDTIQKRTIKTINKTVNVDQAAPCDNFKIYDT